MKKIAIILMVLGLLVAGCTMQEEDAFMPGNMISGNMMNGNMMQHMVTSEEGFIIDMIPHHQEAVDTAKLTLETTTNPEVEDLTRRIITAQETEIEMMESWLNEWYPESNYESDYVNMMPDLESLDGEARDRAFLQGMVMHHQMAVMMANHVLMLDPRPEVADFARQVIEVQTSEIEEMRDLLREY